VTQEAYLEIIQDAGFKNIEVKKIREIVIPEEMIRATLPAEKIELFNKSGTGIFSLTVVGFKN